MKIPETANVGAYYGNDENGQWQANGVAVDNGVGGGDAPAFPHVPSGYVMAGAYYAAGAYEAPRDDFEDYMWMENEEEFDKQVMQQLEEEALMEQCIEAMLEDEQRERQRPVSNGHNHYATTSNGSSLSLEETVSRSKLNPLAAEFVPIRARPQPEETQESTEVKTEVESAKEVPQESERTDEVDSKAESKTEVSEPTPQIDPPEVSAADIQPIDKDKKEKITKRDSKPKTEVKKVVKTEVKKAKPAPVKSEPKAPVKKPVKTKPEVKPEVKSEVLTEVKSEEAVAEIKQTSPPPVEESQPGIKPINYAAAAKANKPKKATSPVSDVPKTEKPKPVEKIDKKPQIKEKVKEKIPQRKNSAK